MANQSVSPHEAEIARKKLAELSDEKIDEIFAGKAEFTFSGYWESDKWVGDLFRDWMKYKPKTNPKYPGEDLYGEYTWTYNFSKQVWERQD